MQILIREAKNSDYSAITEICAYESVIQHTGQIPGLDIDFWQGFYSGKGVPYQEWVAECANKVVAHLGLLQQTDELRAHVCSFGLVVHPDYQGKGVGSALMEKLIEIVDHELKLSRIELTVSTDNPEL